MFVFIVHPYGERINNIRIIVHRCLIILLATLMVICKVAITIETEPDSPIMLLAWAILVVLILGLLLNFPFIIWKTYQWIRTNSVIDMKLFL